MKSQITTYCHIVVLAICFSLLIAKVSGIFCVQCTSETDPYCQLARMHDPTLCPPSTDFCVTTVEVRKNSRGSKVSRGCSRTGSSGCRLRNGSYVCRIPCGQDGCNANVNFLSGLPLSTVYGSGLK